MYAMELTLTTILPGKTPCLECIFPENPAWWQRRFPVFGAVAGTAGCLAAMEAIKVLSGIGEPLAGTMLCGDLGTQSFRKVSLHKLATCPCCSGR